MLIALKVDLLIQLLFQLLLPLILLKEPLMVSLLLLVNKIKPKELKQLTQSLPSEFLLTVQPLTSVLENFLDSCILLVMLT